MASLFVPRHLRVLSFYSSEAHLHGYPNAD
jgi:hypothetical protein